LRLSVHLLSRPEGRAWTSRVRADGQTTSESFLRQLYPCFLYVGPTIPTRGFQPLARPSQFSFCRHKKYPGSQKKDQTTATSLSLSLDLSRTLSPLPRRQTVHPSRNHEGCTILCEIMAFICQYTIHSQHPSTFESTNSNKAQRRLKCWSMGS
jgi:hypothetical protein